MTAATTAAMIATMPRCLRSCFALRMPRREIAMTSTGVWKITPDPARNSAVNL